MMMMMMMTMSLLFFFTLFLFVLASSPAAAAVDFEELFQSLPDPKLARDHLEYYTAQPHLAGTPRDFETANWTLHKWLEYGLDAWIEEETVLLNYPVHRRVAITYPADQVFVASLQEPWVPEDPTSNNTDAVASFNGYTPSGNVTAELVYVNYGTESDFEYLVSPEVGISLEGKLLLARYGRVHRGIKAMLAQEYGAVGLLIYSDPADDGFTKGATYPNGPWRPQQGVQRGSVGFSSICPGDKRDLELCLGPDFVNSSYVGRTIPSIPVMPLSWGDAQPLLMGLQGNIAPPSWHGAVPNVSYAIGPGPIIVNFDIEVTFNITSIWNVVGRLEGHQADRQVLLGNHRDAWVFGAVDPSSGSSVLMEIARSLGKLVQDEGWKPQRTITFLSWDGEEYGLIGSTVYGKKHKDMLSEQAVAYLNVDIGVGGSVFGALGTPSLLDLMVGVASSVPYPNNTEGVSVMDTWNRDAYGPLGSGSDFTVFIDYLGIPSIDMYFDGPTKSGIYHSIYDSLYWMDQFGDPSYSFHQGMARVAGLAAMRLADATVLPFNYVDYASKLTQYLGTVIELSNSYNITLDIEHVEDAIVSLTKKGQEVELEKAHLSSSGKLASDVDVMALNDRLMLAERMFLGAGIPGRPFFRHVVQAPGLYKGYEPDVFPGVIQAIEDGNMTLAQDQLNAAGACVRGVIKALTPPPPSAAPATRPWVVPLIITLVGLTVLIISVVAFLMWRRRSRSNYQKV
eukprot:TRINITY_DN4033_c0_g2_i2.p1 TRINITY_DN4033_c0_g2~~TRINITY_DN4033_c0_g2_i2.p1  ORF type:complete len:736 (-),score=140.11 TRINITY_DN4033_c0_g2_i2:65-2272(-)